MDVLNQVRALQALALKEQFGPGPYWVKTNESQKVPLLHLEKSQTLSDRGH